MYLLCCAVQAHVSSQFLEDHLFVLQPVASGQQQLSSRVVHLALQYLTHALELKDSYKLMKPHVEGLLVQVRTLTQQLLAHTACTSAICCIQHISPDFSAFATWLPPQGVLL